MKKMKKIMALVVAMVMVLAMGFTVRAAEPSHSITITNTNSSISIKGRTYSAYKLFDSTHVGEAYAYTMSTSNQFYSDKLVTGTGVTADSLEELLRNYFTFKAVAGDDSKVNVEPKTGFDARSFADAIQKFLTGKTATSSVTATEETAIIVLPDGAAGVGYYVVTGDAVPTDPNSKETVVSAVIITNEDPTPVVHPKAGIPTLDKKITGVKEGNTSISDAVLDDAGKAAVAKVGSTVSYELDSIVPDLTGYIDYTFMFGDKLSAGLDYVKNSFVLKIKGTTVDNIKPNFAKDSRSFTLTIPYAILKQYASGDAIVLEYSATVNADSLTYNYVDNTANLTYSNNPYSDETNETPKKKTYVININIDVDKVAESEEGSKLEGAEFKLYRIISNDVKEYYKWDTTNNVVTWVQNKESGDTFTTGTNGALTQQVRGLDKGTYYLVETKAPTGYNLLENPVDVTISVVKQNDKVTYESNNAKITNGEVDLTSEHVNNQPAAIATIINNTGSILPSTGGIGTTIFYVVGGILVVGAAILLVTRRRMRSGN